MEDEIGGSGTRWSFLGNPRDMNGAGQASSGRSYSSGVPPIPPDPQSVPRSGAGAANGG